MEVEAEIIGIVGTVGVWEGLNGVEACLVLVGLELELELAELVVWVSETQNSEKAVYAGAGSPHKLRSEGKTALME